LSYCYRFDKVMNCIFNWLVWFLVPGWKIEEQRVESNRCKMDILLFLKRNANSALPFDVNLALSITILFLRYEEVFARTFPPEKKKKKKNVSTIGFDQKGRHCYKNRFIKTPFVNLWAQRIERNSNRSISGFSF